MDERTPSRSPAPPEPGPVAIPSPQPPASQPAAPAPPPAPAERSGNPVRALSLLVLAACAALFAYHVASDRLTPFSSQAAVDAFVVPVAAEVAGQVAEVAVRDNQIVRAGDVLVRIDPGRFQLQVAEAEATLAAAGQDVGALSAGIGAEEAKLTDARTHLWHMQTQARRVFSLVEQRAMAAAHADQARAAVAQAEAAVAAAQANVEKAKEQRGQQGPQNAKVKSAMAALDLARRDLADTTVRAPTDGVITNLQIAPGYYAAVGQPLMTFIATSDVWVEAAFRENALGNIRQGNLVDMVLDVRPGSIQRGVVVSLGWGVADESGGQPGELATVRTQTGWLKEAQRFPVRIAFAASDLPAGIRVGSGASVVIYTGEHPLMNALARIRIRLASFLTYAY